MHTEGMQVYWIHNLSSTTGNTDSRRKENRAKSILKETLLLKVEKKYIKRGKQKDWDFVKDTK